MAPLGGLGSLEEVVVVPDRQRQRLRTTNSFVYSTRKEVASWRIREHAV
jgi:hypothetical protein